MTRRRNPAAAVAIPSQPQSAADLLAAMERAAAPAQAALDRLRDGAAAALRRSGAATLVLSYLDCRQRLHKMFPGKPGLPLNPSTWKMIMDLSALMFAEQAEMALRNPIDGSEMKDEQGRAVTITLMGIDHPAWPLVVAGGGVGGADGADEHRNLKILAGATLGWSGVKFEGQELRASAAAAEELYAKLPWLRRQAEEFITDRKNYQRAPTRLPA